VEVPRLPCNIDSRGKLARLIYGIILLLAGVGMILLWAIPAQAITAWIISIATAAGGAFAIFESRAGWCVIRALGIRTRI